MNVISLRALTLAALTCATMDVATISAQISGSNASPTFSRDVAPILYDKCVSCHRAGEIGPMSLITYREVRPWVASIRDKVSKRIMPPWHADAQYGSFRNDRSLSTSQIDAIVRWVDGGAPEGDRSELPAAPGYVEGWQIGTPDVVFEMPREFEIPARGAIEYQYFEVPTNFTEDRWMQAGEARAGDRAHVHHIIVSVIEPPGNRRPTVMNVKAIPPAASPSAGSPSAVAGAPPPIADEQRARRARFGSANMLVNWAVGEDAPIHADGVAKRIPAGSTLLFQVHYTTNGTPGTDRSKIGLIFSKHPPAREVRTGSIANAQFTIPPGAPDHLVEAEASFSSDVKVWSMHPHMHFRGKDMTYTATFPDGRSEIVLKVPAYDFHWQGDYWLKEPLTLPKGSTLRVTAHFDNSPANRNNPNPKEIVRWGDQTWEEMMIGFMTYTVEEQRPSQSAARE